VNALRDNEQQLLKEIDKSVTKADKNVRILHHTTRAHKYIKNFMENGTASEMIDARHGEWLQNFIYDPFEENISGIVFKPNEELCDKVTTGLGLVLYYKDIDPMSVSMKVEPCNLEAMRKAKLMIQFEKTQDKVTRKNVSIQFTPKYDVKVEEIQKMTDDGEITLDFTPHVCGELRVDVQVHGNGISNSPLVMDVQPQEIKEATGHSKLKDALNRELKNSTGVAVNKSNSKIAVTDCTTHCVKVFSPVGDLLMTYGHEGSGEGQLQCPEGVAFLNETELVIADSENNRICVVNTTTEKLVRTFGCHGSKNGQFIYPSGLNIDDEGNIIVCDHRNNRVQVFTNNGDYLYHIRVPSPVNAVKHEGRFYISDSDNSVVRVVKMVDNEYFTTIAIIKDRRLWIPFGLAVDNNDNLLVCDGGLQLIHKFTLYGGYKLIGRSNKLLLPVASRGPGAIALLNDGQMICTTLGKGVVFFNNN